MKDAKKVGKIDLSNSTTTEDVIITKFYKGRNMHHFSVPWSISIDQACKLQGDLCYHPAGYGLYNFESTMTSTTWMCGSSCD